MRKEDTGPVASQSPGPEPGPGTDEAVGFYGQGFGFQVSPGGGSRSVVHRPV